MSRFFTLFLLAAFSSLAIAQNSSSSTTPTQVVYAVGASTITTYNVDPQTLTSTQAGALTVNTSTLNYSSFSVTPSAHDRALYVMVPASGTTSQQLTVYATNALGVPQSPNLQDIQTTGLQQIMMAPNGQFLYAVFQTSKGNNTLVTIGRYQADAEGKLADGQTVASYQLPDPGTAFCSVSLLGFNAAGNVLYDSMGCGYPDSQTATYYARTVDLQTGTLGPEVEVFTWDNGAGGFDNVQLVENYIFDFATANNFQVGLNSVNVYPLVPNSTTPVVQCTASMMQSCGYAGSGAVHPSGKYLFMYDSADFTEIDKVELSAQKIVDTGNYIPFGFDSYLPYVEHFSPDGTLVYASGGPGIEIYGFNAATSEVTPGTSITIPGTGYFLAAQRD